MSNIDRDRQFGASIADATHGASNISASPATETWKEIPEYEGIYEVSSEGRIYSLLSKRLLKPYVSVRKGIRRYSIKLTKDGAVTQHYVHRLVALAFIGPSELMVLHGKEGPEVNALRNIRYGTNAENMADMKEFGNPNYTGRPSHISDEVVQDLRRMREAGYSYKDISNRLGVKLSFVGDVLVGRRRSASRKVETHV